MADQQVKVVITTDATNAVTGIKNYQQELAKTQSASDSFATKLKANWIAATAAIYAAVQVINKAYDLMKLGAKAQQAEDSFKRVAESSGESADKILANMKRATAGTIDDSDLMQRAVKGMMLGLSGDTMVKIAEMARLGARVAGTSVADALEGITNAVATGMPKALKQYGLALGPEVKIITAAQTAGVKGINLMTLAQINFDLQLARHGAIQANANEQIQVFNAQLQETKETIGAGLLIGLQKVYAAFQDIGAASLAVSGSIYTLFKGMATLESKLTFGQHSKDMAKLADQYKAMADSDFKASADLAEKASANLAGVAKSGKSGPAADAQARVAQLEKDRAAFLKDVKDRTLAVKNAPKLAQKIDSAELKSAMDVIKNTYETAASKAKEKYDEIASAAKEAYDETAAAADFASQKEILLGSNVLASELAAIKTKQDAKATELQANLDARKIELQTDLDARKKENDDEIKAINKSKENEEIKNAQLLDLNSKYVLDKQKLQAGAAKDERKIQTDAAKDEQKLAQDKALELIRIQQTTLVGGLKKGFDDIKNDYEDVGKGMADVTKTAFSDMTNSLVDFVKTGKLNFESLIDNMITGILRLMVQEQLAGLVKLASSGIGDLFKFLFSEGPSFGSAKGNIFDSGNLVPFARGGIINRPMIFPMAQGAGLMGEAGPEAVMPLTRLAGGDLGVRSVGGSEPSTTNNTFVINAVDAKSFDDLCRRNPNSIVAPMMNSLRNNKTRSDMKGLLK